MQKIKLRGHHIATILAHKKFKEDPKKSIEVKGKLQIIYGKTSAEKFSKFIDEITPDTIIEIVESTDSICAECDCPYMKHCIIKDYDSMIAEIIKRYPPFANTRFAKSNPSIDDPKALEAYGVKPGDIKPFSHFLNHNQP